MSEISIPQDDTVTKILERSPRDEQMLSPQLASSIFIRSFEFSQNKPSTQENIFRLVHRLRPDWKLEEPQREEFEKLAMQKIKAYLGIQEGSNQTDQKSIHAPVTEERIVQETKQISDMFYKIFSVPVNADDDSEETLAWSVNHEMMSYDLKYMSEGRPRHGVNPHTLKGDPYASMVVDYGLKGKTTGIKVYDEMFSLIRDDVIRTITLPDDHPQKSFHAAVPTKLIQVYNERHPDSPVTGVPGIADSPTVQE